MTTDEKWGLVSTIKAPARDILNFVAHHLDLGAHRMHIYLDEDCPEARVALEAHPRCFVTHTDDAYWTKRRRRPEAHQARQTANATRAYRRRPGVTWLGHIDVDEFLWPSRTIGAQLNDLPLDALTARIRPMEALAKDPNENRDSTWFKACDPKQKRRNVQTKEIYPNFGAHLNGGFLSHVSGKLFVRTGVEKLNFRIHNAFIEGEQIQNNHDLTDTRLCHFHAHDWQTWITAFRYRLNQGSYRPSLTGSASIGTSMHTLFTMIEDQGGESALRDFYNEVCTATPDLRERLAKHSLLHRVDLDLDAKRARHFPEHA